MIAALGRGLDWITDRIGRLPTTNLRIVVTLGLVVATGIVYLVLAAKIALFGLHVTEGGTAAQKVAEVQWTPDGTWLAFLAAMSGLDALTFTAKRMTQKDPAPASQGAGT